MRRLIVCADGTWQSALFQDDPEKLTNISRIFTAINRQDTRHSPPIDQVKLYLPGVGTGEELMIGAVSGALGDGVLEKVREAYHWICGNYEIGDEIHLYGFSRGGYLVRLLSSVISLVGILDPISNLLPTVFGHLTSKRNIETKWGRRVQDEWTKLLESDEIQHRKQEQVRAREGGFLVQVLGVFETVPLYHLHSLTSEHDLLPTHNPFGLSDSDLEPEIAKVFQALALAEVRPAYVPVIYKHNKSVKGQELLQVWLPGSHSDAGGGHKSHELADVSLNWLVAHVQSELSLNLDYISGVSGKSASPWGSCKPLEELGRSLHHISRHLPHGTDDTTHEHFHQSLLEQNPLDLPPDIRPLLEISDHELFLPLTPFEQHRKDTWPIQPSVPIPKPLPLSAQTAPLDSPRLITDPPTVFHVAPREEGVMVTHSLASHSRLRQGFRSILAFERGLVAEAEELHQKAAGAGILPRDSRGR